MLNGEQKTVSAAALTGVASSSHPELWRGDSPGSSSGRAGPARYTCLRLLQLLLLLHIIELGLVLRQQQVEEARDEEADAVGSLKDHDDSGAYRAGALIVLDAAVAVGVGASGYRDLRSGAVEGSAHLVRDSHFGAVDIAASLGDDGGAGHSRKDLARQGLGPEANVVREVQRVEGEAATALEEMRLHGDAEAECERQHEDERVAAGHIGAGHLHARDEDHRKQLQHHAADDADRDGTGRARGAAGKSDDAVVLREGGVGRSCHQAGDERVDPVGEQAALDARVDVGPLVRRQLRRDVRHANVANRLGRRDEEANKDGQEVLSGEAEREGLDPQEGDCIGVLDGVARVVVVLLALGGVGEAADARLGGLGGARGLVARERGAVGDSRHKAAKRKTPEQEGRLEERRAEELDDRRHDDN
eukprot:scaffold26564_cov101-Isochrysis_galbana.AAC.1